jgi:hypothetical protein
VQLEMMSETMAASVTKSKLLFNAEKCLFNAMQDKNPYHASYAEIWCKICPCHILKISG